MNIGVDFGTTYSTFAQYDTKTNTVSEVDFGEAEKSCVPSVVGYDTKTKRYSFGSNARDQMWMNSKRYEFFRAFKMLLPERDKALLESRGYTQQTPREISKRFLGNFLNMAKPEGEKFEKMVMCVPEIWNGSSNTVDGRNNIREICRELDVTNSLQIVTEPEAASAYFVYNYELQKGSNFSGYVLTVDYGGGTLDITLTKTRTINNKGKKVTHLQSLARSGRGENHEQEVGAAGMAYMEGVVTLALRDAGLLEQGEEPVRDIQFLQAVNICEKALMSLDNQKDLRQTFGSYNFDYKRIIADFEDEFFEEFTYGDTDVTITYSHLVRAYQSIIYPVLDDGLNHIISLANTMGEDSVNLLNPREEVLYASVGGFGKFVLVEQQVYKKLGYTASQQMKMSALTNKRESAVALGAALIAAGVITIQPIATHSLGIYAKREVRTPSGRKWESVVNYAIRYGQAIEPNKKYYIHSRFDPTRLMAFAIGNNALSNFLIGYNTNYNVGCLMPVRDTFLKKLRNLPNGRVAVGFSQDEDGVIRIHIHPVDDSNNLAGNQSFDICLSTYNDLFDTVEAHVIQDGEEVHI